MAWWKRQLGDRGERAAARFLRRQGYKILARKQRSRLGELDLVALDGETIVFVEVKTRASTDAGQPAEAVTPAKQQKLTRLALGFLKAHGLLDHSVRFDVVGLLWPPDQRRPTIEHFRGAFEATGRGQMYG